jgi:[pyruvate, phosphate dikinase]-phosphate phosphotransferase / [pyruvate, phosphate dikinase] kinase
MIGCAKPLAAPLQAWARPPSPAARRLPPSFCAPDTSPALTRAVESPGQSQSDDAPPPRSGEAASSLAPRASSHLDRWSRSRALRSGHRPALNRAALSSASVSAPPVIKSPRTEDAAVAVEDGEDDDVCEAERDAAAGKAIYIVSDGTGWTAEHSVNAALGQFENCLADRGCAVNTHLFSLVKYLAMHLCTFFCWKYVRGVLTVDRVSSYDGRCPVLSSNYRISQLGYHQ